MAVGCDLHPAADMVVTLADADTPGTWKLLRENTDAFQTTITIANHVDGVLLQLF